MKIDPKSEFNIVMKIYSTQCIPKIKLGLDMGKNMKERSSRGVGKVAGKWICG